MSTSSPLANSAPYRIAPSHLARITVNSGSANREESVPIFEALLQLPIFTEPSDIELSSRPSNLSTEFDDPKDELTDEVKDRADSSNPIDNQQKSEEPKSDAVHSIDQLLVTPLPINLPNAQANNPITQEVADSPQSIESELEISQNFALESETPLVAKAPIQSEVDLKSRTLAIESESSNEGQTGAISIVKSSTTEAQPKTAELEQQVRDPKLSETEKPSQIVSQPESRPIQPNNVPETSAKRSATVDSKISKAYKEKPDQESSERNNRSEHLDKIRQSGSTQKQAARKDLESLEDSNNKLSVSEGKIPIADLVPTSGSSSIASVFDSSPLSAPLPDANTITNNGVTALVDTSTPSLSASSSVLTASPAASKIESAISSASTKVTSNAATTIGSLDGRTINSNSEATANRQPPTEGSSRGTLTEFQEAKLLQRVMRGFEQMGTQPGQVRLRLHPPQLGSLQLTLQVESEKMSARLEVESQAAHDSLVENLPTLRERLSEQGIQVERFEVQIKTRDDGNANAGNPFDRQSSDNGQSPSNPFRAPGNWRSKFDSRPSLEEPGYNYQGTAAKSSQRFAPGLDLRF